MSSPFDVSVWQELAADPAHDGLVRRRVVPDLVHDVFVGEKRPSRERVLLLDIKGQPLGLPQKRPSSRGLSVEVDFSIDDLVRIRLTSTSTAGDPLFAELAADVVSLLAQNPGEGAAARVLERVIAWQSFFAARREEFSLERAAGLFAELTVLSTVFLPAIGASPGLVAWCGPDPGTQDFQHGNLALEVKSFRGNGPGQLIISSERQLESASVDELYIAYLRLDQRPAGTGVTLDETIAALRDSISGSPFAVDLLQQRLLSYGWHNSSAELRTEKYHVRSSELFKVIPGFPRITSEDLPFGVGGVSYTVDRSAIEAFLVPWAAFADRLREQA